MSINVKVTQLGKPDKTVELSDGSTISDLMSEMGITTSGKQFTVRDSNGANIQSADYRLEDFAVVSITAKNENGAA